jgi:hypothetical protein
MAGIQLSRQTGKEFLDVQEFSAATGLSVATVRRYLRKGHVHFVQPAGPRGRILIPSSALACLQPNLKSVIAMNGINDAATEGQPSNHDDVSTERLPGPQPRWERALAGVPR